MKKYSHIRTCISNCHTDASDMQGRTSMAYAKATQTSNMRLNTWYISVPTKNGKWYTTLMRGWLQPACPVRSFLRTKTRGDEETWYQCHSMRSKGVKIAWLRVSRNAAPLKFQSRRRKETNEHFQRRCCPVKQICACNSWIYEIWWAFEATGTYQWFQTCPFVGAG